MRRHPGLAAAERREEIEQQRKIDAEARQATLGEAARRASDVVAVLSNPTIAGAFTRLEQEYAAEWAGTAPEEKDKREAAYFRLTALRELRADLERVISDSKVRSFNDRLK